MGRYYNPMRYIMGNYGILWYNMGKIIIKKWENNT
nr:MAG TPA: hypothetical protein [Caudoviricetes sp.]